MPLESNLNQPWPAAAAALEPLLLQLDFIHTFIHLSIYLFWSLIYCLFETSTAEALPASQANSSHGHGQRRLVTDKEEGLDKDVKFGGVGHQKEPQLKGKIIPC